MVHNKQPFQYNFVMSDTVSNAIKYPWHKRPIENAFFQHHFFFNDLKFYDELQNELTLHYLTLNSLQMYGLEVIKRNFNCS